MSFDSPKPRREIRVDLSGLSEYQILVRRGVVTLGERAFGPRWQTDLAIALSEEAGRRITQAQVSQWIAGTRPVPEGLIEPLQRLAMRAAEDLKRRADEILADWAEAPPEVDNAIVGMLAPDP